MRAESLTSPITPSWAYLLRHPRALLAFGFGSGLSPIMPGTCGTLAAVPFFLLLAQLPIYAYLAVVVLAFVVGIHLCGKTAQEMELEDPGGIVWDEFVGLWIALIGAPAGWHWLVLGFVLFRVFDMLKPWPISLADKHLKGGFGIMFDDVLAGIAAWACLQGVVLWLG